MSKSYIDHCLNYNKSPCAQESSLYTNSLINNSPHINHEQIDMICSKQVINYSQYPCIQSGVNMLLENVDGYWYSEQRLNEERVLRQVEKVDNTEITSKDLSPASFCSNLDLLLPEFYKNANKDVYCNKTQEQQLIYNSNYNQRVEYPSCAQVNSDINVTSKCGSTQKEGNNYDFTYPQYFKSTYNVHNQCQELNTCVNTDEYYLQNQIFETTNMEFAQINIDQQTEGSNEESDIIVEDSEDETDFNELYNSRCVICNCFYISNGIQFYLLTEVAPLTMSTQKPLNKKIMELLGPVDTKRNYLCSQCLGLINTIDHLQFKLENVKTELTNKFKIHTNTISKSVAKPICNSYKTVRCKSICRHAAFCKICKRKYSLVSIFNRHMNTHKNRKRYLCDICGKHFRKNSIFNKHLRLHSSKNICTIATHKINVFICKVCNILFRTKTKLREHENYCLSKLPFRCKYLSCNKNFTTSTKLKYHIKLKHDKKFTSICSICNIGFIKPSDYKSHMVSHSTEKKYQCLKCEKSYKTASNLNFHMKFHSKMLPFNCKICKKGFMRKDYLESHVNSHKGIKKFACYICNGKFISQKYLDSHMKYHDGIIKKKSCNLCGKLTLNLQDHMRSHNNLKEFNCNECNTKFNTKSAMYKHKKRKHSTSILDR